MSEKGFFSHLIITSLLLYIHVYPNITHFSSSNEQSLGTMKISNFFFRTIGTLVRKVQYFYFALYG